MLDNKCKKCRRAGQKLFLKGEKCFGPKCPFTRKPYPPGILGKKKSKHGARGLSEYGAQLRERQSLKFSYGLRSRQFENYLKEGGDISSILGTLESRLDNVVFRMGLSDSRSGARQLVSHGHILVDGKRVDIPSYTVKLGEEISVKASEKLVKALKERAEILKERPTAKWLEVDSQSLKAKVTAMPTKEDVGFPIQEQLIVELYSK